MGRLGILAAGIAVLACCSKSGGKNGQGTNGPGTAGDVPDPTKPTFTVLALAEVRGQIGPCGCTTDPLGDIARTTKLVVDARAAGPTLVVDAGSLLYGKVPVPAQLAAQEDLKADLLANIYKGPLRADVVGLGPADLGHGLGADLKLPRQAANVDATKLAAPPRPPEVLEVGGAKVGVFTVVAEGVLPAGATKDPVAAGKAAVAALKKRGAQVVVGMVQADSKKDAAQLVREIGGIDLAVAGLGASAPEPDRVESEPTKVGDGWLVVPANRGQLVARVAVTLRGAGGPLADAVGPGAAAAKTATIDKQLKLLDADLARLSADQGADPAFVAQKKSERAQLAAQRDHLAGQPFAPPAAGSYFTLEQVRINKKLACDTGVQDRVTEFYRLAGEANVKAAQAHPVQPPRPGESGYAGTDACSDCHQDQVDFWNRTVHAKAWKTLVDRGQQFDFDCIGCHVTGYDRPGGSSMGFNDKLRDVQCEVCHGPSAIHVAKGGLEKPFATVRDPAPELCATQCHTHEHSDTFQHDAYLRDIVGKGHGEERRKQLGDGPTGAALRKAGLEKAGTSLGAGCIR
ncbi:MAG: hypothetical protein KIT31_09970 [Deltaproteobacteria bacterium]|nr:hypothetical protein [Deltaproteobacteria bacterium]